MTDSMGPEKLDRHMQSPSYTYDILNMPRTGTKQIVRHSQKSGIQWSVISMFACNNNNDNNNNDNNNNCSSNN